VTDSEGTAEPTRRGRVSFVGAGPGAADLLTLRAAQRIGEADIVIWAASLVHEDVLQHARADAVVVNSAEHSLEGIRAHYERAAREGLLVARVHSGDPALWGGTQEQHELCTALGLETEVIPGVSSFSAVAALVQRELTIPEVAQSVVLTRLEGGKTPMPSGESVRAFAAHGTTMALFLSAARTRQLQDELLAAGTYDEDTPCVVAYAATWPDELVVECRLGELAATVKEHRLYKHTLVLVGPALAAGGTRSHLYHPGHFHEHRKVEDQDMRADLRARDAALRAARETASPGVPAPGRA
jgi:precorrin-4/cobalt-precorrin-4 C11-methyltransferase